MSLLKKGASRGYAPRSLLCSICNCLLTKFSSGSGIRVFNCGHAIHVQCELPENDISSVTYSNGCPVCLPKKKGQRSRSKALLTENGLVSKSLSKQPQAHGNISTHPHENDALENSYGSQQISRVSDSSVFLFFSFNLFYYFQSLTHWTPTPVDSLRY